MRFVFLARHTLVAFVCSLSTTLLACDIGQGERSESGECPLGETCSNATPHGLILDGPHDGSGFRLDDPLPLLAVGGRMVVSVRPGWGGQMPAFDVVTDDPQIATAQREADQRIRLEGMAAGGVKLRVLEAGTDKLLDRHGVGVRDVARVVLSGCGTSSDKPDAGSTSGLLASGPPITVSVTLRAADDSFLVDEDTRFDPPGRALGWAGWNLREIDVPKSGSLTIRASTRDQSAAIDVPTFAAADGYRAYWYPYTFAEPEVAPLADAELSLARYPVVCAVGTAEGRSLCNAPGVVEVVVEGKSLGLQSECAILSDDVPLGPAVIRIGEEKWAEDGSVHVVGDSYNVTVVP